MNKKGKIDGKTILVIAVILALLVGIYFFYPSRTKTILEHREPADMTDDKQGSTGLDLRLYDEQGNEIQIPDWFATTASIIEPPFTIVTHPPARPCPGGLGDCVGFTASSVPCYNASGGAYPAGCNANIMCWAGTCALGNVASLSMGISVTNPVSSQLSFLNVGPTGAVYPAEFNSSLTKTPVAKLSPGQTTGWTSSLITVSSWTTPKVFNITVQGTNEYTGGIVTKSDQITLDFAANPTGSLTVSIVSPI